MRGRHAASLAFCRPHRTHGYTFGLALCLTTIFLRSFIFGTSDSVHESFAPNIAMCLAVIALDAHPQYRVVIAANRDEFHARPAVPAHWWTSGMLAGQDLIGGGAWFGVSRSGRWALVTNFREGIPRDPDAPSRGRLVTGALRDPSPPLPCAAAIACEGARYHGFNL